MPHTWHEDVVVATVIWGVSEGVSACVRALFAAAGGGGGDIGGGCRLPMVCINMYNSEHQSGLMGPRISFSCDFITDAPGPSVKREPADPSAPEFEFSPVDARGPMLAADELFHKGRLLPLREQCAQMQRMTLREELQAVDEEGEEEEGGCAPRPTSTSKGPTRWKGLLGRRRAAGSTTHKKQQQQQGKGEGGECSGGKSVHPT